MGAGEGFAGSLPGRFVRTMSITIGGVPKAELYERAKAVRTVSPYAKRIMKHEQFTTLPDPETVLLIALTPEDLGFTDRPTIAEALSNERLADWSDANLPGWQVTLNPAEVGPHLAIQYTGQMEGEFLWVGIVSKVPAE
jgi:hypothetical protein